MRPNIIWEFGTANFRVVMTAEPEYDLDLSWDETGDVADKIERGVYSVFCAKCTVYLRGAEVGNDYLGQCIYENVADFRDHIGMNGRGHGSYFSDMVRQAIAEARKTLCDAPRVRCA